MKKHLRRGNPPASPVEQAVQEHLPYALAELLVSFAESGHALTRSEVPLMAAVVTNILRNQATRPEGLVP